VSLGAGFSLSLGADYSDTVKLDRRAKKQLRLVSLADVGKAWYDLANNRVPGFLGQKYMESLRVPRHHCHHRRECFS
jgi:hypothetical protein